ncbi:hypothetical protein FACS1894180_3150 [Bacteroidia bacterium]|nr:hypothetical protein FACS1894180_3150 [Bacteroidia bacterium]
MVAQDNNPDNHNLNRHKERVGELLTSEEGLMHRSKRPIEVESVFGQTKSNKGYNRFRHFGKDKVMMDFAVFVVAFNIGKLFNKQRISMIKALKSLFVAKKLLVCIVFVPKPNFSSTQTQFLDTNLKLAV